MTEPGLNKHNPSITKRLALVAENIYDWFHRGIARITGRLRMPMTTQVYHAMRHEGGTSVKGRVLRIQKWRKPRVDDHPLVNLWQIMKLWCSPERPNTLVRAVCGDLAVEQRSDGEGYFDMLLPPEIPVGEDIVIQLPESEKSEFITVEPRTPGASSRCLVISDIDDTIMISHAAKTLTMIGITLFGNALTRQIFPGTPELYQSLQHGTTGVDSENNPFAFVTSSPFNLHGLIQLIFKENRIPRGAFFMTDWGMDHDKWFRKSHGDHKLVAIRDAMNWYPDRPAVLIGDSGQHDAFIYQQIAGEFPGRVAQILIRNVSDKDRIQQLKAEVKSPEAPDVPFHFFKDTKEAADILLEDGWLTSLQHRKVVQAFKEQSANPLDQLLHKHKMPDSESTTATDSSPSVEK